MLREYRDRVKVVSMGRAAHDGVPLRDIDGPVFLNANACGETILCRAVKSEGRAGDLEQQRDVFGAGVASKELRILLAQQHDIGFRFGVSPVRVGESDGGLDANPTRESGAEQPVQSRDNVRVRGPLAKLVDQLSLDEFVTFSGELRLLLRVCRPPA
jgi:hypothetical protein